MSFSVTGAHVCVVLFYFVYLFIEEGGGACGWVVDTPGHRGGSILHGLGCWPTVGLFWAPDLPFRRMLLLTSIKSLITV